MKIKGIIFDMDGVIADSEPLSCYAWNILYEKYFNIDIGRDYADILGKSSAFTVKHYAEKHGVNPLDYGLTEEQLIKKKDEVYFQLAEKELKPVKGVKMFLQFLQKRGLKIALASSGTKRKIEFTLNKLGFKHFFQAYVSAEEVKRGKPFPDVFLEAMKRIQIKPNEAVIIEDTLSGIQAAKASKAHVIAITTTFPKEQLQGKADYVAESYEEITQHIQALLEE